MNDLEGLMSALNGMTATALGANISSDIHRAAQDNARMIFQEIMRNFNLQESIPGDDAIRMSVKIGVGLAKAVAAECSSLFAQPKPPTSVGAVDPTVTGALTQEEFEAALRDAEEAKS